MNLSVKENEASGKLIRKNGFGKRFAKYVSFVWGLLGLYFN